MRRLLSIILALILILTVSTSVFALPTQGKELRVLSAPLWMPQDTLTDNENLPLPTINSMASENSIGRCETYSNGQKFTNFLDGYSVILPFGMTVDLSYSETAAIIKNSYTTLKIFKETFKTNNQRLSYLVYSNGFTQNTADHTIKSKKTYSKGGREYHLLEWSRPILKKVVGDQNHYLCIDVCEGARVYTFFFTSSLPFSEANSYMSIVDSLTTFDPTISSVNAYHKGYKKGNLSHLNQYALAFYNKLFSDDAPFRMGMFPPERFGGIQKMEEFESYLDYTFPIFLQYTEFTDYVGLTPSDYTYKVQNYIKSLEYYFDYAQKSGKAIELTLQTPLVRNTANNAIYEILNGNFDQFLKEYTSLIVKYPTVTVFFRPFNEMNGDWCNYSAYHTSRDPQVYVELYRYLYRTFSDAGCSNVIWVWNPNERSFPNFKWNSQDLYYPGDEYVDVYGITGYNTGTYYQAETWRSFDEIYKPIYQKAIRINEKPIMITEFSCSSIGGDKISWIEDMFRVLPNYDKIKVGIWWHAADYNGEAIARSYFMDTPDGTLDVFKKYLNKG